MWTTIVHIDDGVRVHLQHGSTSTVSMKPINRTIKETLKPNQFKIETHQLKTGQGFYINYYYKNNPYSWFKPLFEAQ